MIRSPFPSGARSVAKTDALETEEPAEGDGQPATKKRKNSLLISLVAGVLATGGAAGVFVRVRHAGGGPGSRRLIITDVATAIVGRSVPRVPIFFLTLPFKMGLGLAIMAFTFAARPGSSPTFWAASSTISSSY